MQLASWLCAPLKPWGTRFWQAAQHEPLHEYMTMLRDHKQEYMSSIVKEHPEIANPMLLLPDKLARLSHYLGLHALSMHEPQLQRQVCMADCAPGHVRAPVLEACKPEHAAMFRMVNAMLPRHDKVKAVVLHLYGPILEDLWAMQCVASFVKGAQAKHGVACSGLLLGVGGQRVGTQGWFHVQFDAVTGPLAQMFEAAASSLTWLRLEQGVAKAPVMQALAPHAAQLTSLLSLSWDDSRSAIFESEATGEMLQQVLPHCTALTALDLEAAHVNHEDYAHLASSLQQLQQLRQLALPRIWDAGNTVAQKLHAIAHMSALTNLNAGEASALGSEMDAERSYAAFAGAMAQLPQMQRLQVHCHDICNSDCPAICQALAHLSQLTHISMACIHDVAMKHVATIVTTLASMPALRSVSADLRSEQDCPPEHIRASIAAFAALTHVCSLDSRCGDSGLLVPAFHALPRMHALRHLQLRQGRSIDVIAAAVRFATQLESLVCQGLRTFGSWRSGELQPLLRALTQHQHLTHLGLPDNMLADDHVLSLAGDIPSLCALRVLDLRRNELGRGSNTYCGGDDRESGGCLLKLLTACARLRHLQTIDLADNYFSNIDESVRPYVSSEGMAWMLRRCVGLQAHMQG